MAISDHIAVIQNGKDAVQAWRVQHPNIQLDLSGASLENLDLRNMNLEYADLSGCNLSKANLQDINLAHATLKHADISNATFSRANLEFAVLDHAVLSDTNLTHANLSHTSLYRADLLRCDLIDVDFTQTNLGRADLTASNLARSRLSGANLYRTNLTMANLSYANLTGANLIYANLSRSNLHETDFSDTTCGYTTWTNCNLTTTLGLESVHHAAPSDIDLGTHAFSLESPDAGHLQIARDFFRQSGGSDDAFGRITTLLNTTPSIFQNCYLLHAEIDRDFALQLSHDLNHNGAKCWLFSEIHSLSEDVEFHLENALRAYDKIIVICSLEGLHDRTVLRQVAHVIQPETMIQEHPKSSIFAVTRDDYLMTEWTNTLKPLLLDGYIADFRSSSNYGREISRLAHALKSE